MNALSRIVKRLQLAAKRTLRSPRMKKASIILLFAVMCSTIALFVDKLLGFNIAHAGHVAAVIHTTLYLLWGAALMSMYNWLQNWFPRVSNQANET